MSDSFVVPKWSGSAVKMRNGESVKKRSNCKTFRQNRLAPSKSWLIINLQSNVSQAQVGLRLLTYSVSHIHNQCKVPSYHKWPTLVTVNGLTRRQEASPTPTITMTMKTTKTNTMAACQVYVNGPKSKGHLPAIPAHELATLSASNTSSRRVMGNWTFSAHATHVHNNNNDQNVEGDLVSIIN